MNNKTTFFYNFIINLISDASSNVSKNHFKLKKVISNETNTNYRKHFCSKKNKLHYTTKKTTFVMKQKWPLKINRYKWINSILLNPKFTYLLVDFFIKHCSSYNYNKRPYHSFRFSNLFSGLLFPHLNLTDLNFFSKKVSFLKIKPIQYNLYYRTIFSKDYNTFTTSYLLGSDYDNINHTHNFQWNKIMFDDLHQKCKSLLLSTSLRSKYEKHLFKDYYLYISPLRNFNLLCLFNHNNRQHYKSLSFSHNSSFKQFEIAYTLKKYKLISYILPYFFYWYYYNINTNYQSLKNHFFFYSKSFFSFFYTNLKYVFNLLSFYNMSNFSNLNNLFNNSFFSLPNKYYNYFYNKKTMSFFNSLFFSYRQDKWYSFKTLFYENSKSFSFFDTFFLLKRKNTHNSFLYDNSYFFFDKLNTFNSMNHVDNKYLYLLKSNVWKHNMLRKKKLNYNNYLNRSLKNKTHSIVNIKTFFFDYSNTFFSLYKSSIVDVNMNYFFSTSLYKYHSFILKSSRFFYMKDFFLLRYKTFIHSFFFKSKVYKSINNINILRSDNLFSYKEFFFFFFYFSKKNTLLSNKINTLYNDMYKKLYYVNKKHILLKLKKHFNPNLSFFFKFFNKMIKSSINKKKRSFHNLKKKFKKKTLNQKRWTLNSFRFFFKKYHYKNKNKKKHVNLFRDVNKSTEWFRKQNKKNEIKKNYNTKFKKYKNTSSLKDKKSFKHHNKFNKKYHNKHSMKYNYNNSNKFNNKSIRSKNKPYTKLNNQFNNKLNNRSNKDNNDFNGLLNKQFQSILSLHKKHRLWIIWSVFFLSKRDIRLSLTNNVIKPKIWNDILNLFNFKLKKRNKIRLNKKKSLFNFNKTHKPFSLHLTNNFNSLFKQYNYKTFKLNETFFDKALTKRHKPFLTKAYNKKEFFTKLIQIYLKNNQSKKKIQLKLINRIFSTLYSNRSKRSLLKNSFFSNTINTINHLNYCSFKFWFLKSRLTFFLKNVTFLKSSQDKKPFLSNNLVMQQKKHYNYEYEFNDNNLSIYEGSSINIFYSQLFTMINYFFFFIKQCCFIHFLSDSFSEYKCFILIYNLTSPLFIVYNNLYNFNFMEWFFDLNLKDYF